MQLYARTNPQYNMKVTEKVRMDENGNEVRTRIEGTVLQGKRFIFMKTKILPLVGLGFLLIWTGALPVLGQSVLVDMGSAWGAASAVVQVPLLVQSSGGARPVELRLDISYNPAHLSFRQSLPGPAAVLAEKTVVTVQFPTGSLHVTVSGTGDKAIGDGIFAYLEFQVNYGGPVGTTPLTYYQTAVRNLQGQTLPTTTGPGMVVLNGGISNPGELYFPQIADGLGYQTRFVLLNPGSAEVSVLLELFRQNGKGLVLNLNGEWDSAFLTKIPANGALVLESANGPELQVGWARVRSSAAIGGSMMYSYAGRSAAEGAEEAGIDPSVPADGFLLAVDSRQRFQAGLAVANPNADATVLELSLYDAKGSLVGRKTHAIAAYCQTAALVQEFFPDLVPDDFSGILYVTATPGKVVSTTLRFNSDLTAFASVPVLRAAVGAGTDRLYFPQMADGGGYRTTFLLTNPGTADLDAVLETFGKDGTPLTFTLNQTTNNRFSVRVPSKGLAVLESGNRDSAIRVGWARVTASAPVGGSIVYDALSSSARLLSEAGIDPAPLGAHFCYSVDTRAGFLSGLAVANPTGETASLELKLYSAAGALQSTQIRTIPGQGQLAEMAGGLFPGVSLDRFTGIVKVLSSTSAVVGTTLRFSSSLATFASIPVIPLISQRGGLDTPKEGETVSGTVAVSGWGVLLSGSSGLLPTQIKVLVDGIENTQVQITRNVDRTDMKDAMARQGFVIPAESGFRFTWDISKVAAGAHTLSIQAQNPTVSSTPVELARRSVTVMPPISGKGALESPRNGETVSGTVTGTGWGVILIGQTGSLPADVKLMVDGREASQVQFTRKIERTDIRDSLTNQGYTVPVDLGFRFTWNSTTVSTGSHVLSIQITNETGISVAFEVARISVSVIPPKTIRGSLENPKSGDTLSGTVTGSGWAAILSGQTGTLPAQIKLQIDGKDATSVTMTRNIARQDVKDALAAEGITVPADTGFRFTWGTTSVSEGAHTLTILAINSSGTPASFELASIPITVKR